MLKTHLSSARHWSTTSKIIWSMRYPSDGPHSFFRTGCPPSSSARTFSRYPFLLSPLSLLPSSPSHFLLQRAPPTTPSASSSSAAGALPWPAPLVPVSRDGDPLFFPSICSKSPFSNEKLQLIWSHLQHRLQYSCGKSPVVGMKSCNWIGHTFHLDFSIPAPQRRSGTSATVTRTPCL